MQGFLNTYLEEAGFGEVKVLDCGSTTALMERTLMRSADMFYEKLTLVRALSHLVWSLLVMQRIHSAHCWAREHECGHASPVLGLCEAEAEAVC